VVFSLNVAHRRAEQEPGEPHELYPARNFPEHFQLGASCHSGLKLGDAGLSEASHNAYSREANKAGTLIYYRL
jgi:hypothetical protein